LAKATFDDDLPMLMIAQGNDKIQTALLRICTGHERPWGGRHLPPLEIGSPSTAKDSTPKHHLVRFRGRMQAGGQAGFEDLCQTAAIRDVACMARVRRKFVDIH